MEHANKYIFKKTQR